MAKRRTYRRKRSVKRTFKKRRPAKRSYGRSYAGSVSIKAEVSKELHAFNHGVGYGASVGVTWRLQAYAPGANTLGFEQSPEWARYAPLYSYYRIRGLKIRQWCSNQQLASSSAIQEDKAFIQATVTSEDDVDPNSVADNVTQDQLRQSPDYKHQTPWKKQQTKYLRPYKFFQKSGVNFAWQSTDVNRAPAANPITIMALVGGYSENNMIGEIVATYWIEFKEPKIVV